MGLAEGAQPHILDAAELGLEAWKEVMPQTIKSCVRVVVCWRKCDILPPAVHADLDQDVGKNIRNKKESLEELTDLVQRLSLEAKKTTVDEDLGEALEGLGLAPGATPTRASMEAVQTWLRAAEKEGVAEAIIADLKDDLCEESLAHQHGPTEHRLGRRRGRRFGGRRGTVYAAPSLSSSATVR
ncbi:unnamed protein product [Ectocarpus sp. CCAP 1310/34]|nr:unnamed protein product [Ectocarpus sp. CCAP 1310/34]